jgi:putative Mg2+ transporter-C (MgtC) family protein
MSISDGELLLRLGLTVVLCGAIGLEREARGQAAGLRTHILVGVGAALFTLVSAYAFESGVPGQRVDPSRIAAQIVTGIGFLGAGSIIQQGLTVRGLTTAAALWVVAAIGMAVGAGYYLGATASTGIILVSLIGFRRLRPALMARVRTDFVTLDLELRGDGELGDVLTVLGRQGARVEGVESEHEEGRQVFRLELFVPQSADLDAALQEIRRLPTVRNAEAHGWGSPSGPASPFRRRYR